MKLVSVTQMRAIEKEADASGLSYVEMMENAGRRLAEVVLELGLESDWKNAVGLVGPGNNGGDTLVALAYLAAEGWQARAYCVKRITHNDELIERLIREGGELVSAEADDDFDGLATYLESADVLLDGLLGTGITLPLKQEISSVLEAANDLLEFQDQPAFVVAVDCPSGVDCDTGEAAPECIPADLTVTMAAVKQGLLKLPAFEYVGELKVVNIGLPPDMAALTDLRVEVAEDELVSSLLPDRPLNAHKGTFGTALITAGSVNYTGAALLSGQAAYRAGAGLVTMAVPEPLHAALAGHLPEATWVPLPHESGFISQKAGDVLAGYLERATAFLIGPGFGLETSTRKFVENILSDIKIPVIVDADGLKLLSQIRNWQKKLHAPAILTPHPGEMSVLTGLSKEEIQENRQEIAARYAREWGHVLVLKGAFTLIASPDDHMSLIPVASPALARAGSGDVLAGLIVGFLAQGLEAYDAAIVGAYIHARAGLLAADDLGTTTSVLAGDILNSISDVMSELE
jgi:hydroxyethylthiazole kinase-like uncharacterized protein yjeF